MPIKSDDVRTPHFNSTLVPIWHTYRNLHAFSPIVKGDILQVELYDRDVATADDLLWSHAIPADQITTRPKSFETTGGTAPLMAAPAKSMSSTSDSTSASGDATSDEGSVYGGYSEYGGGKSGTSSDEDEGEDSGDEGPSDQSKRWWRRHHQAEDAAAPAHTHAGGTVAVMSDATATEATKAAQGTKHVRNLEPRKEPGIGITLRRVTKHPQSVRVFLIRHGESMFQTIYTKKHFRNLFKGDGNGIPHLRFDHPLTEDGIKQAQRLNRLWKEAAKSKKLTAMEQGFIDAEVVFSSPLTRAVQTALLGLNGHPGLENNEIKLLRSARELKKLADLGTVGEMVGCGIAEQARTILKTQLNGLPIPHINPYDCNTAWWTGKHKLDTSKEIEERLDDLMDTLRYHRGEAAIVVCHSLLARQVCRQYFTDQVDPEIHKKLTDLVLPNAGVMGLDVDFSTGYPRINHAELLFGTEVKALMDKTSDLATGDKLKMK